MRAWLPKKLKNTNAENLSPTNNQGESTEQQTTKGREEKKGRGDPQGDPGTKTCLRKSGQKSSTEHAQRSKKEAFERHADILQTRSPIEKGQGGRENTAGAEKSRGKKKTGGHIQKMQGTCFPQVIRAGGKEAQFRKKGGVGARKITSRVSTLTARKKDHWWRDPEDKGKGIPKGRTFRKKILTSSKES